MAVLRNLTKSRILKSEAGESGEAGDGGKGWIRVGLSQQVILRRLDSCSLDVTRSPLC